MKKTLLLLSGALMLAMTALSVRQNLANAMTADGDNSADGKVGFVAGSGITPPINPGPDKPGESVDPLLPEGDNPPDKGGPLSIDFVSKLDFGINQISNKDQTYFAKAQKYEDSLLYTANYLQVSDNRGSLEGWMLKVVESSQFKQEKKVKHPVLDGARLSFKSPVVTSKNTDPAPHAKEVLDLIPGQETIVAVADKGSGSGTWAVRWGTELTKAVTLTEDAKKTKEIFNPDVTLFVPGKTVKDEGSYSTKLNWILSELPQNY